MLTKDEILLCAEAARHYPPGNGRSYIAGKGVEEPVSAADKLAADPALLAKG